MRPSMAGLSSLKKSETTIFGASRRVPSLRNENKSLRLTIRCWKGSVPPTTITEKTTSTDQTQDTTTTTNKITRKDFPTEFKFGCSTSAFQVCLSLINTHTFIYIEYVLCIYNWHVMKWYRQKERVMKEGEDQRPGIVLSRMMMESRTLQSIRTIFTKYIWILLHSSQ